ncbi:MAG TPA: hypothetical protein VH643_10380 [Gemmataceae bacterium]|jgi:hypothetical protein
MPNDPPASYKFVCPEEQRKQLKAWAERAAALGIVPEYLAALKSIQHHLTTDPLAWGDPCYQLNNLGLQVYQKACTPLHLWYAVDTARQVVYVARLTPFSGSGLEQEE